MTAAQGSGGAVASEAEVDAVAMLLALDAYERGLREMGYAPKFGLDAVWRWLFDEDRARHRAFARRILDAAAAARPSPAGEAAEVEDEIDFVEATLERARLAENRATAAVAALAQARAENTRLRAKLATSDAPLKFANPGEPHGT